MADNITVDNGALADYTVRTVELAGGIHAQVFVPYQQNRQDTFTIAGNGTTVDVSLVPCSGYGLQLKGTGAAATAWEVVLEVSLDGTNFTTVITHRNTEAGGVGDGKTMFLAIPAAAKYFRSRCVSVTLGGATNIVATIIGVANA